MAVPTTAAAPGSEAAVVVEAGLTRTDRTAAIETIVAVSTTVETVRSFVAMVTTVIKRSKPL